MATKEKNKKEQIDVDELDQRHLNPRVEAFKGFMENFSTFAAFGLLAGVAVAAITIAALAFSAGGIGAIAAGGLGAKSIALGITFAASAVTGIIGGTHYAVHRMHHAEQLNETLDEARDLLKRKRSREAQLARSPERDDDEPERRPRPRYVQDALERGPRSRSVSHVDRYRDEDERAPSDYRLH